MEQVKTNGAGNLNKHFLTWCLGLPVISFIITLAVANSYTANVIGGTVTHRSISAFLNYYERNHTAEFFTIFINNSFSAIVMVYFTPFVLFVRRTWEKMRNAKVHVSRFEKFLLYSFPAMFLVREAVRIAITVNGLSGQINKSPILTFLGIVFPHGLPEFIVFGVAGAFGMEVTKHCFSEPSNGRAVEPRKIILLITTIGLCAYLEVSFTPKVFAILMSASGLG